MITSSDFAKLLWPGLNSIYGKAYNEHKEEYTDLFDMYTSKKAFEEDLGITSFGLAQNKSEGSPISFDDESQAFLTRYVHVVYGLGFIITREMVEDDQYAVVGQRRSKSLAFSMRQTKEVVGANVYNRAFNASYTGGDGVQMISTAHVNHSGGVWSNRLAVDADLSEASLEQATIDIMKMTNDRGLKINIMPKSLIVPVDLTYEAERILKTSYRVGTNDNDINAMNRMGVFPEGVKANHYLTDPNAWFIRTNVPDGMKCFKRRAMEFTIDNDFDTENAKFKATERYSFGWTDPRAIFGTSGA
jgi:hypothetical protein